MIPTILEIDLANGSEVVRELTADEIAELEDSKETLTP